LTGWLLTSGIPPSLSLADHINMSFLCSVKQFISLVRKMDVNVDTISPKVNIAVTRLEKKYDVTFALYQRFVK